MLSRSRTLIRTLNPLHDFTKSHRISTFPFLSQEAQLAAEAESPPPPPPPQSTPMPPQNWQKAYPQPPPLPPGQGSLIPINNSLIPQMQGLSRTLDSQGLMDLLTGWATGSRWFDVKQLYEVWVTCLDSEGKHNKPDVGLFNLYLRANLMTGASPANLLDFVVQAEDFGLKPNTASYNLVLKGMYKEPEAAVKLLERMLIGGKESLPDDESYDFVLGLLFAERFRVNVGVKFLDVALKSGYKMSVKVFNDFIVSCLRTGKLDSIVSIVEQCKKMEQNKVLCPSWSLCNDLVDAGIQNDHGQLVHNALLFLAKWIKIGMNERPPVPRSVDQGLLVSALSTAGRTYNPNILDVSWAILKKTMPGDVAPNPECFLAKIYSHSLLGNLPKAFATLREMEAAYGNSDSEVLEELLSPFSSLNPLVLACSRKGFETLDEVYYQLESLSQGDSPYKSLAALNCIILGCANIWDVDRAYQTFSAITTSFGLIPDIHSYNSLICAYMKLSKRDEAVNVFDHFVGLGLKPNAKTYSLLVDVHLASRDPKAAVSAIEEMIQRGYEPFEETLMKVRRRCMRELDGASGEKVEALSKQLGFRPSNENRRNILFSCNLSTPPTS